MLVFRVSSRCWNTNVSIQAPLWTVWSKDPLSSHLLLAHSRHIDECCPDAHNLLDLRNETHIFAAHCCSHGWHWDGILGWPVLGNKIWGIANLRVTRNILKTCPRNKKVAFFVTNISFLWMSLATRNFTNCWMNDGKLITSALLR